MDEISKATVAGVLDVAAGVLGLTGGFVMLVLGLLGGGVLGAVLPDETGILALLPVALFVPLALLNLVGGAMAVAGGVAALQRRRWSLAVAGSIGALVCCFPLGLPAAVVTVMAESEFDGGDGRA